ncbi:transposase [Chryseobacterium lactis]|uniref:Helix-turn-helix domain-containing protein n=1 Tax=Chryseobacterium lactis TaxID=1241981 RepID=A0A3G6RNG5_CHRLC|nr:transposase [Chryseobacterium lactis]AZA82629.1 helix-turn-helix domain-containing protein [Chryseobacterium lactis]AZB03010.1 helix-turn-helix domain-containing protein [Chryseobacterium lactis]PNW11850.1 transposase [Chryseobacterium lactis]
MKNINEPDYKRIYNDLIKKKLPHKEKYCSKILSKDKLEILDVINLNSILFGAHPENQKYKAYNKKAVKKILTYQKKHNLNNLELAGVFSLSRNTITKWKRSIKV